MKDSGDRGQLGSKPKKREYDDGNYRWRFYGDSMLVNPSGEVEMMLEDKESMLVETLEKRVVKSHRQTWQFQEALKRRGVL